MSPKFWFISLCAIKQSIFAIFFFSNSKFVISHEKVAFFRRKNLNSQILRNAIITYTTLKSKIIHDIAHKRQDIKKILCIKAVTL